MLLKTTSTLGPFLAVSLLASGAFAQTNVTPPAEIKEVVAAPAVAGEAPPADAPPPSTDSTNAALSAGGQFATGNSRLAAASGLGKFDLRRGNNAFAASLGGNYAEAYVTPAPTVIPNANPMLNPTVVPAAAPGWKESVENLQAKLRYDRYFSRNFSAFVQVTGTHDAFQALTFRVNADPGVKLLVVQQPQTKLWGEIGYDFQYDDNYTDSNGIEQAGAGGPALDPNGIDYLIQKTDTIHSGRVFAGLQHGFSKDVQLNMGLEYLQGFGGSGGGTPATPSGFAVFNPGSTLPVPGTPISKPYVDPVAITLTGSRLNLDILLAAKLGAGLSFGVGFSAKYNSAPLAGKQDFDTATTLTLIYSFGSGGEKPKPPAPPCTSGPADPASVPPKSGPAAAPPAPPPVAQVNPAPVAPAPPPPAPVAAPPPAPAH
jgi:hypothetical protein